jgi:hypothetical protein
MIANRIKPVVLAAAFVSALVSGASARDHSSGHRHHDPAYRHLERPAHGHHFRRGQLKLISGRSLGGASRIVTATNDTRSKTGSFVETGAYSSLAGSTVYYDDGSRAIYVDRYRGPARGQALSYPAPRAKVINVMEELPDGSIRTIDGCSYEMGVCVIRGGN